MGRIRHKLILSKTKRLPILESSVSRDLTALVLKRLALLQAELMYNLMILLDSRLLFNEQVEAVAIRHIHLICQFDTLYTQTLVTSHLDPSNMKCFMLLVFFW